MSGTGHRTKTVAASGDARIDGILYGTRWGDAAITYSFPGSNAEYSRSYAAGENNGLFELSPAMKATAHFALNQSYGSAANNGFSVEGFTAARIDFTSKDSAAVRLAQTSVDPYGFGTAWTYYPSTGEPGGDVWLSDRIYDYSAPRAGNYAHLTLIHEIGHGLGLEHGHSSGTFGAVPAAYDAMEYTVMTYRPYVDGPITGYTNETWGFAQSYMMLDIAALQRMYGADFTTNGGDTVYSWSPNSGETRVDGVAAISPGDNRIFATIWDGGGTDTYDLSAYRTDLSVDLAPGGASVFSAAQLARLDIATYAQGSIYNALQYRNDPRSLIENAIGGSGDDWLRGNQADNHLQGRRGDDRLQGFDGDDRLDGNTGREILGGGKGSDVLNGGAGNDILRGGGGHDDLNGGSGRDRLDGSSGRDRLFGGSGCDRLYAGSGEDRLHGGAGDDRLYGGNGDDRLFGGGASDVLRGGAGADELTGGAGRDIFRFTDTGDSAIGTPLDAILDFTSGEDRIDLSRLSADTFTIAFGGGFAGTGPHVSLRTVGTETRIIVDTDGDGRADFRVDLEATLAVSLDDFIL